MRIFFIVVFSLMLLFNFVNTFLTSYGHVYLDLNSVETMGLIICLILLFNGRRN